MALPDHAYSDSTDMVKIIVQTVQSQDRVLKELFGHLRYLAQEGKKTTNQNKTPHRPNKCNLQHL